MSSINGSSGIPPQRGSEPSKGPEKSKSDSGKKFELKKDKVKEKDEHIAKQENQIRKKEEKIDRPEKKEERVEKKEEGPKEGFVGGTGERMASFSTEDAKAATAVKEVQATTPQERIAEVNKLITSMVESVQVGELGVNKIASVTLGTGKEVPALLQEAKIGITVTPDGTTITIESKSNAELALLMQSDQNKQQLQQLVERLNVKSLQVGETMINVAPVVTEGERVTTTPPSAEQQTRDQRERGEERGGGRDREREREEQ